MGTPFTSARNGLWDASDVDTWGQGANVYPQTAADVVNIGHTVTYNKVSTTEMGAITINNGGILTFLNSMSTKLTLGHVDITINNGGELRVGSSGAGLIPYNHQAELVWNTTADNARGINIVAGGKFTVYGDPAYYGSKYDYILATQVVIPAATNAVTVTITGNYAVNFVGGQELLIHKGGAYASYINDFARLAVVSAANNGANTDISCTVTERPAALTCLVGADVLNVSRNVMLYKLGYNANLGQYNTNRPRVTNANLYSSSGFNVNIFDSAISGFSQSIYGCVNVNVVIRNGLNALYIVNSSVISGIVLSCNYGSQGVMNSFVSAQIVGCSYTIMLGSNSSYSGNIYGNADGIFNRMGYKLTFTGAVYSNNRAINVGISCIVTGIIGFDGNGISKPNVYDFVFADTYTGLGSCGNVLFNNAKLPITPTFQFRNAITTVGRYRFEHYQQVPNAHYIADSFGDLTKVSTGWTGTPPSGATNCLKTATTQSNLGAASYLDIITQGLFRVWQKAGTVVYKVYIQAPTGNNSNYAAADLVLYADYLDNNPAGTGHTATANSTGGITKANDWTQSLAVTATSAADGWVTLYLRLLKYYAATDVFYVDPGIWAGGNILMGDWSQGELVYPGPSQFGRGGNPALLPLGVMEVVN